MSCKTVSIIVADDRIDGAALSAAADLALATGAHLEVACVGIDHAVADSLVVGGVAMVVDVTAAEARERATELAAWVETRLPAGLAGYAVEPAVAPPAGIDGLIARSSRYSDLIVAARPYGPTARPTHVTILEAALFRAGAPILVVPDGGLPKPLVGSDIVLAWNESDEALAAARAALPWLQAARCVHIVMVDPPAHSPERSDPGGQLCLMLARHGVTAEVSILARTMPSVSDVIRRFAQDKGAAAVVMGGYGHSRLREHMFGGVTRDLLRAPDLPLILSR
ncbi:universal stress protein [Wenxinia marina]|uniref:Universal stress protein UspA n=1 Tax=Wenxinia marina DSM 24838 TaxID=1123501 RepID=A0A0D0QF33_9RHOB|nr:universal stress protein [Wenxinia marina]KIQ70937.1 Universal stress protein UspA [Wenxinia marina DSM 24838]GGL56169.1 universal stress protein UspA [Wenxinia marina]